MTEKIESFSSRKLAESNGTVMTTQNILREARMLKNVIKDPKQQQSDVKEEDDLKEEKEEREMEEKEEQHRSFSRTGNDLIETDDELVEVGSPESEEDGEHFSSRPIDFTTGRRMSDDSSEGEEEYFRPLKRLAEPDGETNTSTKKRGVRSFCIDDILSHKTAALQRGGPPSLPGMHRPWDQREGGGGGGGLQQGEGGRGNKASPLDALFNMISNNDALTAKSDMERAQLNFANKQPPKKKRKSRTAFTNHQIFELEKRFLYQKYLSPADRDEIAAQLGLSNAQVICWFQNRRAKYKRDLEELKKDVEKSPAGGPMVDPRRGPPPPMHGAPSPGPPHPLGPHLHHPLPLPHPLLLSMAPHLIPASMAGALHHHHQQQQPRSPPMRSPEPADSPPIRVEDSD